MHLTTNASGVIIVPQYARNVNNHFTYSSISKPVSMNPITSNMLRIRKGVLSSAVSKNRNPKASIIGIIQAVTINIVIKITANPV